ncbi:MAG: endolytic transglycosylase MltG [Winogradskyella sp.]|nr:endolytic transglycosylase MltG [Winogradskyella sp.]
MYIKKILWAVALIGLVIVGYVAFYIYSAMFTPNTLFNNDEAYIYITSNSSYNDVLEQIAPLVKSIDKFDALAKQKKYDQYIKPGKYVIKKGMTNNEIINSIRSNNLPVKLSFNNQHTLEDLAGRVSKQIEVDSLSLLMAMKDTLFLKENGFTIQTALGMYLPNTYEFKWNTTAEEFRNKMLNEYKRFWTESRKSKAADINLSSNDVMTLASIVHEESKKPTEQPRVAGVYINRLRIGMPLQADPTLKFAAYQLPQYKNTVIRRVLNVHKDIESPYNTYKNRGLPPGLIAMPDLSAIEAVLNYEKHNYLYFAADPRRIGYHRFSTDLRQHNAYAHDYQRYLSSQGVLK